MPKLFDFLRLKKSRNENAHPLDGEIARKHNDNNVNYMHSVFDQREEIIRPYLVVTKPKKNVGPQSCPGGRVEPSSSVVGSSRHRHHRRGTDRSHRGGEGRSAALMNGSFQSELLPTTSRQTDPSSSDELEEQMALQQRGGHRHVDDMRSKHGREYVRRERSPLADRSNMMIMGEESLRQFRCIGDYLAMKDKKIQRLERALMKEKDNSQLEREERRRITQKYRSLADQNDRQLELIRDLQRKVASLQNAARGLPFLPTIPVAAIAPPPAAVPSPFHNNRQPLQQSNTTTPSSSNAPSEDCHRHRQHFTGSNNFAIPFCGTNFAAPLSGGRFFLGERWNTTEDDDDNEVKNFRSSHANSSSTSKQDFLGTDTEMATIKHEFAASFSPTSSITTARMESEFSFSENARGDSMNASDVSRALVMVAASGSLHNSSDSTLVSEEMHDENHEHLLRDHSNRKYKVENGQTLYPSNSAPVLSTSTKQNRSDSLLKISNRGKPSGRDDGYVTCNTSLTRL